MPLLTITLLMSYPRKKRETNDIYKNFFYSINVVSNFNKLIKFQNSFKFNDLIFYTLHEMFAIFLLNTTHFETLILVSHYFITFMNVAPQTGDLKYD